MNRTRNIVKNMSALFSGHAINVLQNLIQVPFFIHTYGTAGYGEWLALSAAVSYLGTLDFGVQTYVNQDLTVRYHGGDMDGFHVQQSTALRLLLGIVATAAITALVVFLLPLQHWLRMDGSVAGSPSIPSATVQLAIYLLALQVLLNIPSGYFFGTFMVIGKAHIGGYWSNVKNLLIMFSTLALVWLHASFAAIALAQLACVGVTMMLALIHLRMIAADIFPSLSYWDGTSVRRILGQSGYFALIWSSNWFLYQVPILILQLGAGPVMVAIFNTMRTIFSMTRQQMNTLTQSMGPEITRLYGHKDWGTLSRLYNYSERLIFSLIPIANFGVLFLSPTLLAIWIHGKDGRDMFSATPYILCACISTIMSVKEHKYQFQFSTNTHKELARFMVGSYIALDLLWLGVVPHFGLTGLLWSWLAFEILQMAYIVNLNMKFFALHEALELKFLNRLLLLAGLMMLVSVKWLGAASKLSIPLQIAVAVAVAGAVLLADFPLFHLLPVLKVFIHRVRGRSASTASSEPLEQGLP